MGKDQGVLKVAVNAQMEFAGTVQPISSQLYDLAELPIKIDLNETDLPTSKRFSFGEVGKELKKYHKSVFQILAEDSSDGLGVTSSGHGTGFFISPSGYALTNLHVIETNPKCLINHSCEIAIKQKNEDVSNFKVKIRLLTCSRKNDFCLLKVLLPEEIKILALDIDLNSISSDLFTLGFPADKVGEFKNEDGELEKEAALTYSFGSPIGFSGTAISSSLFIYGGASGSPIISQKNGKVVGINSNGSPTFSPGADGMPAIFRSIFLINQDFNLLGYLSGDTQARIEQSIKELRKTKDVSEAKSILESLEYEKSFYGGGKLEVLSYTHSEQNIRRLIVKFLKDQKNQIW